MNKKKYYVVCYYSWPGGNGAIALTPTPTELVGGKTISFVELFFIATSVIVLLEPDIKST